MPLLTTQKPGGNIAQHGKSPVPSDPPRVISPRHAASASAAGVDTEDAHKTTLKKQSRKLVTLEPYTAVYAPLLLAARW